MQRPKIELLLMAVGGVIAIGVLKWGFVGERAFDQAALGKFTVEYLAQNLQGKPIHTIKQKPEEVQSILTKTGDGNHVVMFFGNSQTHSINQQKPGEVNYPEILQTRHPEISIRCHSLPNANLQEFLVLLQWWSSKMAIDQLFIPVFMDDLREDGLRQDFMPMVIEDEHMVSNSNQTLAAKLNAELMSFRMPNESAVVGGESQTATLQDKTEEALNDWLGDKSEVWRNRPNARGDFFMKLYQWRNTLFGINASTKRKMIPARYAWNMKALEAIIECANERNILLNVYIPPIRTDVEVPYDLKEYETFKREVRELTELSDVIFSDLDDIVPGELWGLKASTNSGGEPELDYMHFQARGHEILADALEPLILPEP